MITDKDLLAVVDYITTESNKLLTDESTSEWDGLFEFHKNIINGIIDRLEILSEIQNWIPVSYKEKFPDYDDAVLWKYESGGVIHYALDKEEDVVKFLKGNTLTGTIISWMPVPE